MFVFETSSVPETFQPLRGFWMSSRVSLPRPNTRLCSAYGRVESICASEGALMPMAFDALFEEVSITPLVLSCATGLRVCELGK